MKCDTTADGQMFKYSTCCFAKKNKKKWNTDIIGFNIKLNNAQKSKNSGQKRIVQIPGFLWLNIQKSE